MFKEAEVLVEEVYRDGVKVATNFDKIKEERDRANTAEAAKPTINMADCFDQWHAAFRKEKGEAGSASDDQMREWEAWCKEGKRPG